MIWMVGNCTATGKVITSVAGGSSKDVDIAVNAAKQVSLLIAVEGNLTHILMHLGI